MSTSDIESVVVAEIESAIGSATKKPKKDKTPPKPPEDDFEVADEVKKGKAVKGKQLFSKVFGVKPTGKDHLVTCYKPKDWTEDMAALVPKSKDDYVWQVAELEQLVVGIEINDNIWISGPTGSGKSTLIEQYCAAVGRPFIRINGREDMESGPLFGQLDMQDGSLIWKDGSVTEGARGGAVVLVDESTVVPPGIGMGLQWLLEDEGKLVLTDKPGSTEEKTVVPDERFCIVFGDNTKGLGDSTGRHASTNVFNTATLDRFGTSIELNYLTLEHETGILTKKFPDLKEHLAKKMVRLAQLVRTNADQEELSLTMSPRTLLSWANKALYLRDVEASLRVSFYNKLEADEERQAIRGHYKTVFGREL